MWADFNNRMDLDPDDALHGVNLFPDVAAQNRDWPGDVFEGEKLLRINRAVPDEFVVDVGQETFADFDACTSEHESLEGDVGQVDILFQAGGGFDFDQIPRVAGDRHKNVSAGVAAAEGESCLVNRATVFQCFLRQPDGGIEFAGFGINLNAAGEKLLRQFTDFRALIKDGLLICVGRGDLVFGVVAEPEELRALPPHQEGGLGETWIVGGVHVANI